MEMVESKSERAEGARGSKRGNVGWTDGKDLHPVGGRGNNCIGKRKEREGERWELRWRACVSHNISSASY